MKKIILFELNEVPAKVLDYFVRIEPNSKIAEILNKSKTYETITEDVSKNLSPWTTWPTLHRGVIDQKHGIYNFGQPVKEQDDKFPPVWEILRNNGIKTGVFGSLHSYQSFPKDLENFKFYFPDTFAAGSECFPKKLSVFQDFNLSMVKKSGLTVSSGIDIRKAINVLANSSDLGLNFSSYAGVVSQLTQERISRWKKIRRRTLQVSLAFDIFMHQLITEKPSFSTFFTNHVASTMHRFWGACFSEEYQSKYNFNFEDNWVENYKNEIHYTMSVLDSYIKKIVAFIDKNPDYELWVTSSMGQDDVSPDFKIQSMKIVDMNLFMHKMGIKPNEFEKVLSMYPRYNFKLPSEKISLFKESIQSLRIAGNNIHFEEASDFVMIKFDKVNDINEKEKCLIFNDKSYFPKEFGLKNVDRDDSKLATAYHIPQGTLMIYSPKYSSETDLKPFKTTISTLDILPSILKNYGIKESSYMNKGLAL